MTPYNAKIKKLATATKNIEENLKTLVSLLVLLQVFGLICSKPATNTHICLMYGKDHLQQCIYLSDPTYLYTFSFLSMTCSGVFRA